MADEDATKEALSILGLIKSGKIDLTGMAALPRGGKFGAVTGDSEVQALQQQQVRGANPSPLGLDDALPLTLGTAGQVLGGRVAGTPGALMLSAIGAGTGRALNQPIYSLFGSEAPSPTGSRIKDVMLEMGGQTAGNLFGLGVNKTAGTAATAVTPTPAPNAPGVRGAFRQAGVDLNMADVAPSMSALERSVAQTPTGGRIIREQADKRAGQLSSAFNDWLDTVAPAGARERVAVGDKASESAMRNLKQTGALEDTLWTQMGHLANDVPVRVNELRTFANDALLSEKRGKHPNGKAIAFLEGILQDSEDWAWQAADATRKQYGREFSGDRSLISEVPESFYKGAYAALLRDMEASAAAVPGLGQSFANVRAFSEQRRAIFRDGEVAKILETDPENVVKTLKLAGGPSAIQRAREAITGLGLGPATPADQEAWTYVQRHVLEGVLKKAVNPEYKGLLNPVIVGKRLDDALETIGRDGLKELLSDTQIKALDNFVLVAKSMRQSERIGALPGTSATPQGLGFMDLARSPGAWVGGGLGLLGGGLPGAATGAAIGGGASMILVPNVAARILTNPKLAAIVASPSFATLANLTGKGAAAIKEANMAVSRLFGEMAAEHLGGQQP